MLLPQDAQINSKSNEYKISSHMTDSSEMMTSEIIRRRKNYVIYYDNSENKRGEKVYYFCFMGRSGFLITNLVIELMCVVGMIYKIYYIDGPIQFSDIRVKDENDEYK